MTYSGNRAYVMPQNSLCGRLQNKFANRGVAKFRTDPKAVSDPRVRAFFSPSEKNAKPAPSTRAPMPRPNGQAALTRPTSAARAPQRALQPSQTTPPTMLRHIGKLLFWDEATAGEVRVEKKSFPLAAVSILAILTVVAMVMIFSFAQNYELRHEIAQLKKDVASSEQLKGDLTLAISQRDDIRVIEEIAVNEIGMVRADQVQSRYVTAAATEHMRITGEDAASPSEGENIFSTMLSTFAQNFEYLLEHID